MTLKDKSNLIYMDYAATTPVDPRVKKAMEPYFLDIFGNPSSIHGYGQDAIEGIETARAQVAGLIHADPTEIVFTGSGTESDNAALLGVGNALRPKGGHIVTTAIEHHAVLACCEFMAQQDFEITLVPVGRDGIVSLSEIERALTDRTFLISVMHANNEIGTIQPIAEIGALAKRRGVLFHADAVQTFGHLPIDVQAMNLDLLSLSGHKLYGPKGIGALFIRKGTPFEPLIHGGGQENGRRSSTHNVPGIVGLAKAAELAGVEMESENKRILSMREKLLRDILANLKDVHLNGHPSQRLANNINLSIDHVEGEALIMNLDLEGVAASSGSACSSSSNEASHVLRALGLSTELARGSLRLTLGRYTTQSECDRVVAALIKTVERLRSLSSFGRGS